MTKRKKARLFLETLREATRVLIRDGGMTQAQIGKEIGCSQQTISEFLNTNVKRGLCVDTLNALTALCQKHGTIYVDLLG